MKIFSRKRLLILGLVIGTIVAGFVSYRKAEAEQSKQNENVPSTLEKLKIPGMNEALERCFTGLYEAQEEIRTLSKEDNLRPQVNRQGLWISNIKLTNGFFCALYRSETGHMQSFVKRVFRDKEQKIEIKEGGYEVRYDESEKIESYSRRDYKESLYFYPNGGPKLFWVCFDRTSGEASWAADGKLQSVNLRSFFPADKLILPELESALRNGSESTKWAAVNAMIRIGQASIPQALDVLKDGDARSRELAVTMLAQLGGDAAAAVPTLSRYLHEDKSPDVRNAIARCLGSIGAPAAAAIPSLEQTAAQDVPDVSAAARKSLEIIRYPD